MSSYQISQAEVRIAGDVREHLLADPHGPAYHFVVPEGLAHPVDPNGAIFWQEKSIWITSTSVMASISGVMYPPMTGCIGRTTNPGCFLPRTVRRKVFSAVTVFMGIERLYSFTMAPRPETASPRPLTTGWRM